MSVGLRFDHGFEFYRIADMPHVVSTDIYEKTGVAEAGRGARRGLSEPPVRGRVSDALPTFDEASRTLKVSLEMDNPGFALKPGMFVDVEFDIDLPPASRPRGRDRRLRPPQDRVRGPRAAATSSPARGTGWRLSGQVEIVKGLMPGERIVIRQLPDRFGEPHEGVSAGVFGAETDPVCGMEVDEKKAAAAGRTAVHEGHTYYFCADECKKKFEAEPAKYLAAGHDHAPAAPAMKGPARVRPRRGSRTRHGEGPRVRHGHRSGGRRGREAHE